MAAHIALDRLTAASRAEHREAGAEPRDTRAGTSDAVIEPCRDAAQLRTYINQFWRRDHVLARDERMFRFTYMTRWVDRAVFPQGISVLGIYESAQPGSRMLGFLGAIVAPYPRPRSYWLALWHVLPELKGGGMGGKLLSRMQEIALRPTREVSSEGWIGTFGAGPEALPVYLKRGYCVRAARRWVFDPAKVSGAAVLKHEAGPGTPGEDWLRYRFDEHPLFRYERRPGGIYRTEENAWGVVTHCCRLGTVPDVRELSELHAAGSRRAAQLGKPFLMDAWSFDAPGASSDGSAAGTGWTLASDDLPSVFHPPEARGNTIYAVGRPCIPNMIHKGDCDQDRPN